MRLALTTFSIVFLTGALAPAAEPPAVDAAVTAAVQTFQPLWSPPRGQLRGWVIGIDPGDTLSPQPLEHVSDDLSLITAAHLYHFVRRSGGKPVLTRTDLTRAAQASQIGSLSETGCEVCVLIRCGAAGGAVAAATSGADTLLADELCAALSFERAQPAPADFARIDALQSADAEHGPIVCLVSFPHPPETSTIDADARKRCFDHARRLYGGLSRFCNATANRPAPSDKPVPDPLTSRSGSRLERLARSIWPDGRLPDEQVDWFCRKFAGESITNPSLVYFEVSAQFDQDAVILRGRSNAPRVVAGLSKALRAVGVPQVNDQVQSLPDRQRLGENLFGVCRAPMALTYDRPRRDGRPQSQPLFGEPLFLLDRDDDHYLLHGGDGYWGWVHRDAVQPMTAEQFNAYRNHPRGAVLLDIDLGPVRIPRGANVRVVQSSADERVILLPDGSTLNVPAAAVTPCDHESTRAAARVQAALDLLYVPYVFGGRSPLGLDCSGLVSNTWSQSGVTPPRDAHQQAPAGRLVATHWHRAGIQPGDQVFFINESGKIYHTGLALDATHVIHAAPPCVQIGSFDPQDPLYDAELDRNFFMVKRR